MSTEFIVLGALGFVAKFLHGIGQLTWYTYLYSAAYALSGVFVFSMIDKVAFGKRMLAKWWFAAIMIIVSAVPAILLYVLPENLVSVLIVVENVINILVFLAALAIGIYCIVKNKEKVFAYTYSIYALFMTVAYIFQIISASGIRWYNLFLMLALVVAPYVLLFAVKCEE